MTVAQAIAALPDETSVSIVIGGNGTTVGELRAALSTNGPVFITAKEASRRFSYAPETWSGWARSGAIHGAFRDRLWRLPLVECEAHIRRMAEPRRRRRGPWGRVRSKIYEDLPRG